MTNSSSGNHFSLSRLLTALKRGIPPEGLIHAMRLHLINGEAVYIFDDRDGRPDEPSWTVTNEVEIQEFVANIRSI